MATFKIQKREPGTHRWIAAGNFGEDEEAAREAFDDFIWGGDHEGVEFKLFRIEKNDLFHSGTTRHLLEQQTAVGNAV